MKKDEIIKTIIIDARPSVVFRALTDETELPNWFPNAGVRLEPRIGGMVVLKTRRPDTGEVHVIEGRILEFVPDRKLSHTWSNQDGESVVTWSLEPFDGDRTRVTLLHRGISEARYSDTDGGWSYFTGRLASYCRRPK